MTEVIDFDVETNGLQWPYHHAFMYQFGDQNGTAVYFRRDQRREIQEWFERAKDGYLRTWSRFDRHFATNDKFDIPGDGHWIDGMLGAHAINERRSIALKNVGDSLGFSDGAEYQKAVKGWLTQERKRRAKIAKDL